MLGSKALATPAAPKPKKKKGSGLLPGWEAIDDPGGTYYYNSSTGESSYDVPLPADEPDEPEAPAEAAAAAGPAELMMAAAAAGKALAAAQRNLAEAAG